MTELVPRPIPQLVMAGLVPAIHVLLILISMKDVDARDKRGHDGAASHTIFARAT